VTTSNPSSVSPGTIERLDAIRGNAARRSPSVRVLAAYAQHTDCHLATLGFAAGVDFDRLLDGTRFRAPFGQSPFAISRGLAFEKMLRADGYARTLDLVRSPLGLPVTGARVVNLRQGFPPGPGRMPARAQATSDLVRRILAGDPAAPHLIDGAVLVGSVGGLTAYFEADALAARTAAGELRVAEVKSFPKIDDRVDPGQLGSALDQVAVYVMLARDLVSQLGSDPERVVSDLAMLITPRNVGLSPTLSQQRVAARVTRIGRVLAALPKAADVAAAAPPSLSFGPVADTAALECRRLDAFHALADRVGTAYTPGCLSTCGNARLCRSRAVGAGSPCVSGMATVRLLPEIVTLGRAATLTRGATPTAAEGPTAELLARAGRLIDEASEAGAAGPTHGSAA
jgi:hypothetical protein